MRLVVRLSLQKSTPMFNIQNICRPKIQESEWALVSFHSMLSTPDESAAVEAGDAFPSCQISLVVFGRYMTRRLWSVLIRLIWEFLGRRLTSVKLRTRVIAYQTRSNRRVAWEFQLLCPYCIGMSQGPADRMSIRLNIPRSFQKLFSFFQLDVFRK